jgi:hypothetical protein
MAMPVMVVAVTALLRGLKGADVARNRPPLAALVCLQRRITRQREVQAGSTGADAGARSR